ncbi:anthranilate phosphoribosyltransferase [Pseudomonadales bacterium]|nr:anthranilate phosphoribosyltransferase [Pseudomonadales bacterium]MDG1938584.1 anthranilate phosphoribosyltransferase [Pseudomonadales bacterium]
MNIQSAISAAIEQQDLSESEMIAVMRSIMTGEATPAQIAGFLVALRIKGETVTEIAAAATVMRELATAVDVTGDHLVDIVGTGGDGARLFNVSTASTFVAAAAGCQVAKHGNRSVSSSSGAADVLEAADVRLDINAEQVAHCVESVGVGFMFAQNHHGAMRHAIGPRKELGTRTLFNVLGPITNPAGVKNQLLGVYSRDLVRPIADVLNALGSNHVMVVHSADGLDEISIAAETYVAELKGGVVTEYTVSPEQVGMSITAIDDLSVADAAESLQLIQSVLGKTKGDFSAREQAAADIIAINAGAAIYVAGCASDWQQGVVIAQDMIASGMALEKMKELADFTAALKAAE